MYDPNAPEDDVYERDEELERMREHVFHETDANRDSLISLDEFIEQSRKSEFQEDPGWVGLDEQDVYNDDEFQAYQREMEAYYRQHPNAIPPHGE